MNPLLEAIKNLPGKARNLASETGVMPDTWSYELESVEGGGPDGEQLLGKNYNWINKRSGEWREGDHLGNTLPRRAKREWSESSYDNQPFSGDARKYLDFLSREIGGEGRPDVRPNYPEFSPWTGKAWTEEELQRYDPHQQNKSSEIAYNLMEPTR